jgi:hypothetical protein
MTTPPFDPARPEPGTSATPTEPVPDFRAGFAPVEPGPGAAFEPAVRPAASRAPKGSSRILNLALGAAVLVAAAGVAFAVGRATAPASTGGRGAFVPGTGQGVPGGGFPGGGVPGNGGNLPNASFDLNGNPGGGDGGGGGFPGDRGGFGGGLTITGTVDAVTPTSLTIKLADGQTMTVGLDAATKYHQQAPAASTDVTAGKTVALQITGGFRPGQGGQGGNGGAGGGASLGTAGSVTIVP